MNGRLKFVMGDQMPYAKNLNDEMQDENSDFLLGQELHEITIHEGKMCFHEGSDGNEESDLLQEEPEESICRQTQRPQNPSAMAREIYLKMLVLNQLYQDLRSFQTSFSDELTEMIEELNLITFAMGRIYLSLSRVSRLPIQTLRKPPIRDFCGGVKTTSTYLRRLMFDLRRLQREIDNQNIETQLLIINITLMSQSQQLQQMQQYCA